MARRGVPTQAGSGGEGEGAPGAEIWRIYFQGGRYPTTWDELRSLGATSARFVPHLPPPRVQHRRVLYGAGKGPTCVAEVFQERRVIDRTVNDPALVGFAFTRPLRLLDLTAVWAMRAGASMAINSGTRRRAQRWARAVCAAFPDLDGIHHPSSMSGNAPAVAQFERAEDAIPTTSSSTAASTIDEPPVESMLGRMRRGGGRSGILGASDSDKPIGSRGMTRSTYAVVAAGLVLFLWGALPYLPGQIDDAFIVFAYAHNLLDSGQVVWNTGERVEGYSSALHLALMVAGAAGGLDLAVFARVVSIVAAGALLVFVSRPRFGPARAWLLLALATWQPLQRWAFGGLETCLATLLALIGWPLVLGDRRSWSAGVSVMVLYALTRPEGAAWLALALARRVTLGREVGRPEMLAFGVLLAWLGYHGLRIEYFGAFWPAPYLSKLAASQHVMDGISELGRELLSASGIVAAVLLLRRRWSGWALLPLLVQAGLLVRANGDWMGHARLLLPGMVAWAASAFTTGEPRVLSSRTRVCVVALCAFGFLWEPQRTGGEGTGWRGTAWLFDPLAAVRADWVTPVLDDTSFLIEHVPPGAGAFTGDVGLPGNLSDVRIWDSGGLTDRVVAEMFASGAKDASQALMARYDEPRAVWCVRYPWPPEERDDPAPEWMREKFPELEFGATRDWRPAWRCRAGERPSPAVVRDRWRALVERFPSQPGLREALAHALMATGAWDEAGQALAEVRPELASEAGGILSFEEVPPPRAYVNGRGWAMYGAGAMRSFPLPEAAWEHLALWIDVDDPGAEGARLRASWEGACDSAVEVRVDRRAPLELPACEAGGDRRLVVRFLNDEARVGFDRNVYVSLLVAP